VRFGAPSAFRSTDQPHDAETGERRVISPVQIAKRAITRMLLVSGTMA
jgi:hypothetical protein